MLLYEQEVKMKSKIIFPNIMNNSDFMSLLPDISSEVEEKFVYRKNGKSIEKIVEYDVKTGSKIKTTHFDYFNDKKIRSIDEFDVLSGNRIRTINYVLYKSVDEFDLKTGKKIRTINYDVKDENKISSIQEYDQETGKIVTISIYKHDGKTISIIKQIDSVTGKVTNCSDDVLDKPPVQPIEFSTRSYDNIKMIEETPKEDIASLIDRLYGNSNSF